MSLAENLNKIVTGTR